MDACIKNVNPETWTKFKMEAVKHGENMGEFLDKLVESHLSMEKRAENSWKQILSNKKTITEKEAGTLMETSKSFRKKFDCK